MEPRVRDAVFILKAAFAFAAVAGLVATLPLFGLVRWEVAEVWVSVLGVLAAVIAIYAAYLEVQTLFPKQSLRISLREWHEGGLMTSVVFMNDSALIGSHQFEVRLLDTDKAPTSSFAFTPEPDGEWEPIYHPLEEGEFLFTWTRVSTTPFFPGTSIASPASPSRKGMWWRVSWHTERSAGEQEIRIL